MTFLTDQVTEDKKDSGVNVDVHCRCIQVDEQTRTNHSQTRTKLHSNARKRTCRHIHSNKQVQASVEKSVRSVAAASRATDGAAVAAVAALLPAPLSGTVAAVKDDVISALADCGLAQQVLRLSARTACIRFKTT